MATIAQQKAISEQEELDERISQAQVKIARLKCQLHEVSDELHRLTARRQFLAVALHNSGWEPEE